jgi:hypothetical protein
MALTIFRQSRVTDNVQIRVMIPKNLYNNWDEWIDTGMPNSLGQIQNYWLREEMIYLKNYTNIVYEVMP